MKHSLHTFAIIITFSIIVLSCGDREQPNSGKNIKPISSSGHLNSADIKKFAQSPLKTFLKNSDKSSKEDIIKVFGKPSKAIAKKTPGVHTSQKILTQEIEYPGLKFILYGKLLISVKITSNNHPINNSIKIGMTSKDIKQVFGIPQKKVNNSMLYIIKDEMGMPWQEVSFQFSKDQLQKIEITKYLN